MYGCIKTIKIESLSCSNIQISKMSVHFSDASDVLFCLEWKSVALMSDFWRQKCLKWFNYKTSLLPAKDDAIELHSWKCRRVIKKISCNQILVSADCEKKEATSAVICLSEEIDTLILVFHGTATARLLPEYWDYIRKRTSKRVRQSIHIYVHDVIQAMMRRHFTLRSFCFCDTLPLLHPWRALFCY